MPTHMQTCSHAYHTIPHTIHTTHKRSHTQHTRHTIHTSHMPSPQAISQPHATCTHSSHTHHTPYTHICTLKPHITRPGAHSSTPSQAFLYLGRCFEGALSAGRFGTLAPAAHPVFFFLLSGMAGDLESLSREENENIDFPCSCSTTRGGCILTDARL